MRSPLKALLFGFLLWLFAFATSFAAFPLRESWRPMFESIMPVAISIGTTTLALIYFRNVTSSWVREGVLLGGVWFVINVVIDLPLMLTAPIGMTLVEYLGDIGVTYLMIPVITTAIGRAMARRSSVGAPADA